MLFRLSGVFLLRLAERTFLGLLFQEPPRITRWSPFGPFPAENDPRKNVLSQSPRIGVPRVPYPALHRSVDRGPAPPTCGPVLVPFPLAGGRLGWGLCPSLEHLADGDQHGIGLV